MTRPSHNSGEKNHTAKLTEAKVKQIRKMHKSGITQREICKHFPVNKTAINNVVLRKSWKHVRD